MNGPEGDALRPVVALLNHCQDTRSNRLEPLRKLNDIPGVDLPEAAIEKWPRIPLATFATQTLSHDSSLPEEQVTVPSL